MEHPWAFVALGVPIPGFNLSQAEDFSLNPKDAIEIREGRKANALPKGTIRSKLMLVVTYIVKDNIGVII